MIQGTARCVLLILSALAACSCTSDVGMTDEPTSERLESMLKETLADSALSELAVADMRSSICDASDPVLAFTSIDYQFELVGIDEARALVAATQKFWAARGRAWASDPDGFEVYDENTDRGSPAVQLDLDGLSVSLAYLPDARQPLVLSGSGPCDG